MGHKEHNYVDGDRTAVMIINLQVHSRIGSFVTGLNMLHNENYLISTSACGKVGFDKSYHTARNIRGQKF